MVKHLPGQDTRLDNAGCARLCPVHCRITPYGIKAAPAAPLARRKRRALPWRPAHRTPGHAARLARSVQLIRRVGRKGPVPRPHFAVGLSS